MPAAWRSHATDKAVAAEAVALRCLDTPTVMPEGVLPQGGLAGRSMPNGESFELAGWFACSRKISRVVFLGAADVEIPLQARPDVQAAHSDRPFAIGFRGRVPVSAVNSSTLRVRAFFEGCSEADFIEGLFPLPCNAAQRAVIKAHKFEKLAGHLRCPKCYTEMNRSPASSTRSSSPSPSYTPCSNCRTEFEFNDKHLNFLPADLREQFKIADTANVSANGYDETAIDIICNHADGLVLDCGAGFRALEYPNVINFEIVNYPSTDVLGVNERLPFADNTFDAAFSLAVLEHVKDPFASAKEIIRVLQPGGVLYCVVPLLQPVHGYPHHYYNMTSQGLKNLFEEMEIQHSGVLASGLPIWTLTWFLRSWVDGLSGATKKDFLDLKVSDLIGDPITYLNKPYVQQLKDEKNLELASSTMILAVKKI